MLSPPTDKTLKLLITRGLKWALNQSMNINSSSQVLYFSYAARLCGPTSLQVTVSVISVGTEDAWLMKGIDKTCITLKVNKVCDVKGKQN